MPIEHGANVRQRTLLGLALVLLCFNGAALLAFLTGSLSAPGMIVAHAAAATVAAAGAFAARRVSGGVFLALWVLLAGALGCIIWLTTLGAARNAHAPVFADWLDAQMGGESVDGLAFPLRARWLLRR